MISGIDSTKCNLSSNLFHRKEGSNGYNLFLKNKPYYSQIAHLLCHLQQSESCFTQTDYLERQPRGCNRFHGRYFPVIRCGKCNGCNIRPCTYNCKCGYWSTIDASDWHS